MTDRQWIILRTAGPRTLPLTASLFGAGVAAWTPTVPVKKRVPRSPARHEVSVALMPTFVFAPAADAERLARWSRSPLNPHPSFSIFRFDGRVPVLADREIERLRISERKALPMRRRRVVGLGTHVIPTEGPCAGMKGTVTKSGGKWTMVAFGSWMDVQIETFMLIRDEIDDAKPTGSAA